MIKLKSILLLEVFSNTSTKSSIQKLTENVYDNGERFVGAIDASDYVHFPPNQDGYKLHKHYGMQNLYGRFAYYPNSKSVTWWDTPSKDQIIKVEEFLTKYGYIVKKHTYINGDIISKSILTEGIRLDHLNNTIQKLENEWEQLDSQGTGYGRQMEIQRELNRLYIEKKHWEDIIGSVDTTIKVGFASTHSNCLSEAKHSPAVILGAIWPDGEIKAITGRDENAKHPSNWSACNKWRYVPDIEFLNFWEKPTDKELELVKYFIDSKGYNVQYVNIYTAKPVTENKELFMEVTQEQASAALDFLKQKVKSSPFKNKVFLAGGAVRDLELGKTPKDLDVTVVGGGLRGGLDFAVWLAKNMGNYSGPNTPPPTFPDHIKLDDYGAPWFSSIESDPLLAKASEDYNNYYASFSNPVLFPKFGTAKVVLTGIHNGIPLDGMDVEAVAARKEIYTPGSRKPKVMPGTMEDDVFRRDFTVNSLLLDLTTGELKDLTGKGKADIKSGIIRTTSDPEIIFKEDALRMLRAVRFMVQKGWPIDSTTENCIKKHAEWIKTISKERVRDELNKMLITSDPTSAIRKLRDLGLLQYISPELQQAVGMTQNIHHVHDVFDHTMEVLKNTKPELVQRLMGLFHDIGKIATRSETPTGVHFYGHEDVGEEIVDKILRNLKYPLDIINAVKLGVKNHMRLKSGGDDAVKLSDKTLRKFKVEVGDNIEHILDLIHADNIAHADASAMPNQIEKVRQRLASLDVQIKKPVLPINGDDLINMGIKRGPIFGKILSAVTDAWYENPNITREQAMEIVRSMI